MNASERLAHSRTARSAAMDQVIEQLYEATVEPAERSHVAVVAVGGYGRRELSPYSDIDLVLLHDDEITLERIGEIAQALWYPLWERKIAIDHAVRTVQEMRDTASVDFRAAMGMLDSRCVAGTPSMVHSLRSDVLSDWRRDAKRRIGDMRQSRIDRIDRSGWLAHSAAPDLKESGGGLRDAVSMRALVATWLVDVSQAEVEDLRHELLDVRDALQTVTGRRTDKLIREALPDIADELDIPKAQIDFHVRSIGRRIAHLTQLAWRRIDDAVERNPHRRVGPRGPNVTEAAAGVGILGHEIVLTKSASPRTDPELVLRVAAVAASRNLAINPSTLQRLAQDAAELPVPLSETGNRWLLEFFTAGEAMVDVWESLDIAGLVEKFLPEWADIRLRGSSSPVHRFTIDRHSVEACVQANELNREVARPDLLVVSALLHDIGKGRPGDHSEVGEPMAMEIAERWGFSSADAHIIARLVRWHLLLPSVATRRDTEDPGTIEHVADIVGSIDFLDMLACLTEADAKSTSETAWSTWRRGLIVGLISKTRAYLDRTTAPAEPEYIGWPQHIPIPPAGVMGEHDVELSAEAHLDGSLITIMTANRRGVWADIAGALAVANLHIRSARMVSVGDAAISLWEVRRPDIHVDALKQRINAVLQGRIRLSDRLNYQLEEDDLEPRVSLVDVNSPSATVLGVRTRDRRALLWTVFQTIAELGCALRSAHNTTYGDEARDVFYVVDGAGLPLAMDLAEQLRDAVYSALV